MDKVKLIFKPEYFTTPGDYFEASRCAITQALAAAGYPYLRDHGLSIVRITGLGHKEVCPTPLALRMKVRDAYEVIGRRKKLEQLGSFQYELDLDVPFELTP